MDAISSNGGAPGGTLRVLVVDEDEDVRRTVCMALSRRGAEADGVASGETALMVLKGRPFDVVVTDSRSAGMSGAVLAEIVKSHYPAVRVVGFGSGGDKGAFLRAGAAEFFEKPDGLPRLVEFLFRAR